MSNENKDALLRNPRYVAVEVMVAILKGASLSDQLSKQSSELSDSDRRLTQHLLFGTLRIYDELSDRVRQMLKTPIKSHEIAVELALVLGAYELTEMATAPHATINNWVELLREMKRPWAVGLANAILRNIQRGKLPKAKSLSGKMNLPEWMVHQFNQDWGREANEQITTFFRLHPEMIIRAHLGRGTRAQYLARLAEAGIEAMAHERVSSAIVLDEPINVERLPGFFEGDASVQDASAQLAAHFLPLEANDHLLDACAAPGGKTTALMERQPQLGRIVALDQSADRLQYVAENIERIFGEMPDNVVLEAIEAERYENEAGFDKILLDVPCSGTGIMHRNPDIKRLRKPSDIARLIKTQRAILDHAWGLLKPGGQLLYSTCSIFKSENEQQIARFLKEEASATLLPLPWDGQKEDAIGLQILPTSLSSEASMDGFYYALLKKASV